MNVLVWWDRYHFHSFYFYFHSSIFFNPHPNRFAWKHGSPVAPMLSPRPSPVVSTVIHLPWILTSPECPSVKTVWTRNFLNYKFRPFIRTLGILPGPACEDMVTWTSCLCRLWARGSACMSARPWVFRLRKTKQITATWGIPEVLATGVVFFFHGVFTSFFGRTKRCEPRRRSNSSSHLTSPFGSCPTWPKYCFWWKKVGGENQLRWR